MPSSLEQQRILLTQAQPGMVLTQTVRDGHGAILCRPGTTLNERTIHQLTLRGIKRVHVSGQPIKGRSHAPLHVRLSQLHDRFRDVRQHELMARIAQQLEKQMERHA